MKLGFFPGLAGILVDHVSLGTLSPELELILCPWTNFRQHLLCLLLHARLVFPSLYVKVWMSCVKSVLTRSTVAMVTDQVTALP